MDIIVVNEEQFRVTVVIGLSSDETKFINKITKLNKEQNSNELLFKDLKPHLEEKIGYNLESIKDLFFYGNLKEFTGHSRILEPYRISRDRRTFYYRDFTKTLEQQKEVDWLVNKCPDSRTSYRILANTLKKRFGIIASFRKAV